MSQRWLFPDARGPSMAELWRRLEAHLGAHAPQALDSLNPPATEEQLLSAAGALGGDLPSDLAESLRIHDGQSPSGRRCPLVPAAFDPIRGDFIATWGSLSPLDGILVSTLRRRGPGEDLPLELPAGEIPGARRPRNDCAWWVVFVDDGSGDVIGLDVDPEEGAERGRAVAIDHDPARLVVLAPSYRSWFEGLVSRYESGRYFIAGEGSESWCARDREAPAGGRPAPFSP